LLGSPHSLLRHPDMPAAAFSHMWQTLKAGRSWMGMVKNRCKNGDHYWVSAYVTPVMQNGEIVEYQSVRTQPASPECVATCRGRITPSCAAGRTPWQRLRGGWRASWRCL
jgi:aerotaxis receptor